MRCWHGPSVRGDRERAAFLTTHGLLLVLMFNIACSVLLIVFARPLFHLLGARDGVLDLVVAYIRISAIGYPLFGLSMVGTGLMRAIGDPVYPGIVITAGSVLQVLIGPFLIFGWLGLPALGVEGAAWSFVVARSASFLIGVYWFLLQGTHDPNLAGPVRDVCAGNSARRPARHDQQRHRTAGSGRRDETVGADGCSRRRRLRRRFADRVHRVHGGDRHRHQRRAHSSARTGAPDASTASTRRCACATATASSGASSRPSSCGPAPSSS